MLLNKRMHWIYVGFLLCAQPASGQLLFTRPAAAQAVQQSGNVTPGHAACFAISGVIFDCGSPGGGVSVVGTTTTNDLVAFNASGSLIDSGLNPANTTAISGLWNFNGGATAPTRPAGDSSTNVATTAFVNNIFAAATTFTGPVVFDGGLTLNQNVTSTITNPSFSFIGVTNLNYNYNALTSGTNSAMLQVHTIVNGSSANVSPAGAAVYGFNSWMEINQQATGSVASWTGVGGTVFADQSITSPSGSGGIAGVNGNVIILANVTGFPAIVGGEFDVAVRSGGTAINKLGVVAALGPDDRVQGSSFDAAFVTYASPPVTGPNSPGWKYGYLVDTQNFGVPVLDTSIGIAFGLRGAQTLGIGLDLSAGTYTVAQIRGNGFTVASTGDVVLTNNVSSNIGILLKSCPNPACVTPVTSFELFASGAGAFQILDVKTGNIPFTIINGAPNSAFSMFASGGVDFGGSTDPGATNVRVEGTLRPVGAVLSPTFSGTMTMPDASTWTSSLLTAVNVTATGQLRTTFGVPTIASGACGATTNGTVAGNNQAGVVTIGAAPTTVCTVSFSTTITAPNSCVIFPGNATAAAQGTALAYVSSVGTTNFVITGSVLANTVYRFHCI